MPSIELRNVTVDLPIYGAHNMNLKSRAVKFLSHKENQIEVIRALDQVSLIIKTDDRVGIVGPNGAGKTTLLRVMAGILKPSQGEVKIQGTVVSMIDQRLGMDPNCSGIENIFRRGVYLNQSTQQMRARVDEIVEFSGLGDRIRHPLYSYSSGMKARLAFSIATSVDPEILIIDEGIGAADEAFAKNAAAKLNSFISNSGIVIIASHSEELLRKFCSSRLTMLHGKLC